jgi:uroporphyrin-III C-methyltransferase
MTLRSAQGNARALVLAAHGSRRDPAANALVRRLAEAIRARRLFDEVAVAFHQGEPRFETVLDELTADEVTVVPFLTSAGHYTEMVLPEALRRNRRYPELRLRQTPPVGTHGGIAPLVARRATEIMRERGLERGSATLALVGHGTRRHPESRSSTLQLAEILRRRRVAGEVLAAFIDDDPPLEGLLDTAALPHVILVPFLIGGGTHVSEDIPRLLGLSQESGVRSRETTGSVPRLPTPDPRPVPIIDEAIGTWPGMVDIIIDLARHHLPPPAPRFRPRLVSPLAASPGAATSRSEPGTVDLVGGGPGDPGLITTRGLELLRRADVVVHDRLIGSELLAEVRADALLIDVGKGPGHAPYSQEEINQALVEHATRGLAVVRLKGGDPFVFGRGSEEMTACEKAGVPVRVVPGVTSAIAAPAAAGIPVTARGVAHSFTVFTGHGADGGLPALPAWSALPGHTLVVLMGRAHLAAIAARLIAAGRDPATPVACIQSATTADQRVTRAPLSMIAEAADRDGLEAPVVVVIGEVAGLDVGGEAGRRGSGEGVLKAIGA